MKTANNVIGTFAKNDICISFICLLLLFAIAPQSIIRVIYLKTNNRAVSNNMRMRVQNGLMVFGTEHQETGRFIRM